MGTEQKMSNWWACGWRRAEIHGLCARSVRWVIRRIWARHRRERAGRAAMGSGPKCFYCGEPGHDESEESCWKRVLNAQTWVDRGKRWRKGGGE